MSGESRTEGLEHFAPTGGRVVGGVGLALAVAFLGIWALDSGRVPAPVPAAALLGGVLVWAALLRPRVSVSSETLHLRNMLETVHVPLAAIDEIVVRQVLAVRVGQKRFVSPAVGRKLRKVINAPRPGQILLPSMPDRLDDGFGPAESAQRTPTDVDYVDHVEGRLRERIDQARARHGISRYSEEAEELARDVRRERAWPEIAALGAATVLLVLTILL